ncbi:hypothetical protein LXL04_029309 [Taraxacum kok-saghyz]
MNVISVGSWFSPFAYSNSRWCSTTSHHTFHLPSIGLPSPFTGSRFGFLLKQGNSRGLFVGQSSTLSSGDILDFRQMELISESDFEQIVSPDGTLSICGFGSLLSERSARSTFPDLINFRVAKLNGFRRVFAHVAPIFFERGIAKPETKEISSLSVEPCEGESLIVTVFEIKKSEIPPFIEREHEFRFLAVLPETLEGIPYVNPAVSDTPHLYNDVSPFFSNLCNKMAFLI